MSKRQELRDLVRKHPNWKAAQYAHVLGQKVEVVRAAMSALKLSKKNYRPPEEPQPVTKFKAPPDITKYHPPEKRVASKAGPKSSGYLRLL